MADFLDETRRSIQQRIEELRPMVEEFHRLEEAERALAGVHGAPAQTSRPPREQGRPAGDGDGESRRGRPKGTGTRAIQVLELVQARPGITIPELAETIGIKQNYLYRVLPTLQQEGKVRKSGRGWHAGGDRESA